MWPLISFQETAVFLFLPQLLCNHQKEDYADK